MDCVTCQRLARDECLCEKISSVEPKVIVVANRTGAGVTLSSPDGYYWLGPNLRVCLNAAMEPVCGLCGKKECLKSGHVDEVVADE